MRKSVVVTVFVLGMLGNLSLGNDGFALAPAAAQDLVLTTHRLAMVKGVLRLTPAQEPYWHEFAATVRGIAAQQASHVTGGVNPRIDGEACAGEDKGAVEAPGLFKRHDDSE